MSSKILPHILAPTTTRPTRDQTGDVSQVQLSTIRNQFTTSTWLLLGALAQILLSLLPIRKLYTLLPVLAVLALQASNHLFILAGWKPNPYMTGVIPGKTTALFPTSAGASPDPRDDKICIALLSAKSNQPSGVFNSDFKAIGEFFETMKNDLEANAATNGYLGVTTYLGASERATSSEILSVFYFKSREAVHNWAHGPVHREGWDFWTKLVKSGKAGRIALMHEVFEAPKGAWECVYLNYQPTGFGRTRHPIRDENGVMQWVSPLVEAKGRYRSSNGRQGIDDGSGNEKYGVEVY